MKTPHIVVGGIFDRCDGEDKNQRHDGGEPREGGDLRDQLEGRERRRCLRGRALSLLLPTPFRAASSHPGAWGQAGPGRSLQNRLLLQKSHNKRVGLEGPGEGASKAGVDPTLPTLETGPLRASARLGRRKQAPRQLRHPGPRSPPAPSSPEPPPAPGDLLPPSQTPGVPAPAPGGPQAPRAAMPLAPIYPQQPSPSFRPAGSHLLPEAFPDSVAPPAVGRCWCRLLVLGVVPPSSDTGLPFPTETVSRGRGRAARLLLSAPEDSAGQASAGPWLSTFRARQHPRRAG